MAIVFDSDAGTISGLSVGGLPDGIVDAGSVAADVATQAEIDAKANLASPTLSGTTSVSGSSSGTAKIFKTASDSSEIYLYMGTGATKFRKQDDSANTFEVLPDGRGVSQFTAAFWARVNMEGTFSITGSHNVGSVTDRGVGKGTLNFANNLSNANYCVVGSAFSGGGENDQREFQHSNETTWSTSAWDWCTMDENEANNDITGANMVGFGG